MKDAERGITRLVVYVCAHGKQHATRSLAIRCATCARENRKATKANTVSRDLRLNELLLEGYSQKGALKEVGLVTWPASATRFIQDHLLDFLPRSMTGVGRDFPHLKVEPPFHVYVGDCLPRGYTFIKRFGKHRANRENKAAAIRKHHVLNAIRIFKQSK